MLEYEIPKSDGDLCQQYADVPLTGNVLESKIELLHEHLGTQREFDRVSLAGLARFRRGLRAPKGQNSLAFEARPNSIGKVLDIQQLARAFSSKINNTPANKSSEGY